jgi:hypothetical protein
VSAGEGIRRLDWPALRNARDLGGLPLVGGGHTADRVLVRSDTLVRLTPDGRARLLAYGVRSVVDLREGSLVAAEPNPLAAEPGIRYHHLELLPADFPLPVIRGGYALAIDTARARIGAVCRAILGSNGVTVVHCHSGTGRTGILAILLLALAGVAEPAIATDYLASLTDGDTTPEAAVPDQALAHLREAYGGAVGYLSAAGLAADEVARLRGLLRRGAAGSA